MFEINPFLTPVKLYHGSISLKFHFAISSEIGQSLHAVSVCKGKQSQSFAGLSFHAWVNAIFQTGIHQHRHTGMGYALLSQELLFAQELATAPIDETIIVGSYLTIVEWKIALLPVGTPSSYHGFQQCGIVVVTGHIILTLIPNSATHGITDEGTKLSI